MKKTITLFTFLLLCFYSQAQIALQDVAKQLSAARGGDVITIENGIYNDVQLSWSGKGQVNHPIIIKAATPGQVIITGQSHLRLAGEGVEVQGLFFTKGFAPKGGVIEFRNGKDVANNCRITQCAIDNFNPPNRESENSWVLMYGKNNRFDHNSISNKLNHGVTFAVILDEDRNLENHHSIDHNYFGPRPVLGSNGGETIRVGTSQSSLLSSRTKIENNFFEHCDGEVEIISIKSCDNIISGNTFFESAGVLALRHGNRNLVENNVFIGNGKANTGGIRVINEGHTIRNNFFSGLKGDRFFSALAVMNGVPNSLPNRYHQVKNVVIANNTWVNCDHLQLGTGKDNERTAPPLNVVIKENIFYYPGKKKVFEVFDDISGVRYEKNKVFTAAAQVSEKGFVFDKQLQKQKLQPETYIKKSQAGANWYQVPKQPANTLSGRVISVTPSQNSLLTSIHSASFGDVIELSSTGEYLVDNTIDINSYLLIRAKNGLKQKPIIRYNGTKSKQSIFTINDGGVLELDGIAFNHQAFEGRSSASSTISPAVVMKGHYSATVNNCEFFNLQESSYAAFKAQKSTYADTLVFTNCLFRDMSGDAIALAAEKDDAGKYSAEHVQVINCVFSNVLGYAVDLYRGGSDESTAGPSITVDHCVLENVNNKERGAGMRLYGVQNVSVQNTIFSNTGRGGAAVRFDETNWDKISVTHCNLFNSGRIFSFWDKAITGPVFTIKPQYLSLANHNFQLVKSSPLLSKGKNNEAIGLSKKPKTRSTK